VKNDGTYNYSLWNNLWRRMDANGKYAISEDKIYSFNDNCNIALVGDECMYPNCTKIIELDYTEKHGEITISSGNTKLEKQ